MSDRLVAPPRPHPVTTNNPTIQQVNKMVCNMENTEINLDNVYYSMKNASMDVDKTDAVSEIDLDGPAVEFREDLGGYSQEEIEALCDIPVEDIILAFSGKGVDLYLGEEGEKSKSKDVIDLSGDDDIDLGGDDDIDMGDLAELSELLLE